MEWMPSQINLFCAFIAMDKQGRNNSLCGEDKLKKKKKINPRIMSLFSSEWELDITSFWRDLWGFNCVRDLALLQLPHAFMFEEWTEEHGLCCPSSVRADLSSPHWDVLLF